MLLLTILNVIFEKHKYNLFYVAADILATHISLDK